MSNYLAVFVGGMDSPRMKAWMAMPDAERKAKEQEGIAAWKGWMQKHHAVVVGEGGPLGKTKRVSAGGIADIRNQMGGFVVVSADSHEAAARLFENHPHFTIFPGEAIEVMPVMPIPGG
ncbi:MAG TPA: YciI family protein [Rhizomicrobium sp.]|nr:YciI family protein [Rhizomicrobium sp.]